MTEKHICVKVDLRTTNEDIWLYADGRTFEGRIAPGIPKAVKSRVEAHPDVICVIDCKVLSQFGLLWEQLAVGGTIQDRLGIDPWAKKAKATAPATVAPAATTDEMSVLRRLLGIDTLADGITSEVLASLTANEPLLAAIGEAAGITRKVAHTFPDGTVIESKGLEHPSFEGLAKLLAGGATRVWITGEAGTGKTFAVEQIAAALALPLFIVTPVGDKYELLGYKDANGNYQPTELYRWATHDGPAVLLIDEIDGSHPNALLSINAALANGLAVFPTGQVEIDPCKIVIATANTTGQGATLKYSARMAQDAALRDRFAHYAHWGLDLDIERAIAKSKVATTDATIDASQKVRKNLQEGGLEVEWGPRRTYAVCEAVACGFSLKEALLSAGLCNLDSGQQDRALQGVL